MIIRGIHIPVSWWPITNLAIKPLEILQILFVSFYLGQEVLMEKLLCLAQESWKQGHIWDKTHEGPVNIDRLIMSSQPLNIVSTVNQEWFPSRIFWWVLGLQTWEVKIIWMFSGQICAQTWHVFNKWWSKQKANIHTNILASKCRKENMTQDWGFLLLSLIILLQFSMRLADLHSS